MKEKNQEDSTSTGGSTCPKKEEYFCPLVVEALPCSGCFTTCMGVRFPTVDMDNATCFSILSDLLKDVRVPVASFKMVTLVQLHPSIYIRALSVSM